MAKEAVNDYGLTIKQQKFAEGYVATNNASQALIDAGYAPVVRTDTGELDKSKTAKRAQQYLSCLLYTSPSPRDRQKSRMPSSA